MWNKDFLKKLIEKATKNYGMAIADSITTETLSNPSSIAVGSLTSASVKTWQDMKDHIKDCNEARYFLFVQSFLETAEIDQDEFNKFIEENPDNVKFGLEVFKLLEQATIEEQAIMLSTNLSLYAKKQINETEYNENIFIIMRLDRHLIDSLEKYINYRKPQSNMSSAIEINAQGTIVNPAIFETNNMFYHPPMDFVSFGFLEQEIIPNHFLGNGLKRKEQYSLTDKARKFNERFLKKINKDNDVPSATSFNYRRF